MSGSLDEARKHGTGLSVQAALRTIAQAGGKWVDGSQHAKGRLWIYSFPESGDAQLAIPLTKRTLTVYLRGGAKAGDAFEQGLRQWSDEEIEDYGTSGAHSALERAPGLTMANGRLLRVKPRPSDFPHLLESYLSRSTPIAVPSTNDSADGPNAAQSSNSDAELGTGAVSGVITDEMLRASLDRNSATGRAGELFVIAEEIAHLGSLGCSVPGDHVIDMAKVNIAAGYDVEVRWNDIVRYIEVKTTTANDRDFYLTANEVRVLTERGKEAWIYRVRLGVDGKCNIAARLQNPMASIPKESMQPMVWRIPEGVLKPG